MGEQDEQVRGIRTPCEITCAYKVHVPSTLEAGRGMCSPDVLTSATAVVASVQEERPRPYFHLLFDWY